MFYLQFWDGDAQAMSGESAMLCAEGLEWTLYNLNKITWLSINKSSIFCHWYEYEGNTTAMAHKTISAHQLLTGSKHEILKQTGESTLPSETDEKITKFVESKNGEVNELKLKQQISKLVA